MERPAQTLLWSGVPCTTPESCKDLCRTRNVIAPRRMVPNSARTGGWAFISGGEEVLPGSRWVVGGKRLQGDSGSEVRQRFHCAASLAQSVFSVWAKCSNQLSSTQVALQGRDQPLLPRTVTYPPATGGAPSPGKSVLHQGKYLCILYAPSYLD